MASKAARPDTAPTVESREQALEVLGSLPPSERPAVVFVARGPIYTSHRPRKPPRTRRRRVSAESAPRTPAGESGTTASCWPPTVSARELTMRAADAVGRYLAAAEEHDARRWR